MHFRCAVCKSAPSATRQPSGPIVYPTNEIGALRLSPPEPTALTVAMYVPDGSALKNVVSSTVMSFDVGSGVGFPRLVEAIGVAADGSAPFSENIETVTVDERRMIG